MSYPLLRRVGAPELSVKFKTELGTLPLLRATTRAAPSASSSKKGDDERLAVGTLAGSLAFGLAMSASGVGYDDALPLAVRC